MPAQRTGNGKNNDIKIVPVDKNSLDLSEYTNLDESLDASLPVDILQLNCQDLNTLSSEKVNELNKLAGGELVQNDISDVPTDGVVTHEGVSFQGTASEVPQAVTYTSTNLTNTSTNPVNIVHLQGIKGDGTTIILNSEALSPKLKPCVVKRHLIPAASGTTQMVTKLIIAKTPGGGSQTLPVQLVQTLPLSTGEISLLTTATQSQGGSKTVTISPQGIVSSNKQYVAAIPSTPPKRAIPMNKIPISPKTQTKIMMTIKSPKKIAPATSSIVVAKSLLDTSGTSLLTTGSTGSQPATITMSPSKIIYRQPANIQVTQDPSHPQTVQVAVNKPIGSTAQPTVRQLTFPMNTSGMQQIHVPGHKFHYVRLVSPATPQNSSVSVAKSIQTATSLIPTRPIAPVTIVQSNIQATPTQMKITIPVAPPTQPVQNRLSGPATQVQRFLLPAPNQVAIRPAPAISAASLAPIRPVPQSGAGLPVGTTIISSGNNMQGLALIPASYMSQIQSQLSKQQAIPAAQLRQDYVPIASSDPAISASTIARNVLNGAPMEAAGSRPRKPCNCTKSQCLKLSQFIGHDECQQRIAFCTVPGAECTFALPGPTHIPGVLSQALRRNYHGVRVDYRYSVNPLRADRISTLRVDLHGNKYCDCFANGEFCHNCNCTNCANNLAHEDERSRAIKSCLDRNPQAFHPKIGKGKSGERDRRHNKGCNCKRSGCLKNYCECYEAKIMCSSTCKCIGCKNFEESPERKTLMHLADAAEVRVLQQTAAKTKLSSQISSLPSRPPMSSASGERLPYSFVTSEVAEATCACLLAQAEEAERLKLPIHIQEQMVLEEFGRCLVQIIESASKTKATSPL